MNIDPGIYDEKWYYTVELEPGRFTKGFNFKNIAATRTALDAVDVTNHSVIDLSTMEGMFSTLLAKRGAVVTATDIIDCGARISLLKKGHGVDFLYIPHVPPDNQSEYMFKFQTLNSYSQMKPLKAFTHTPYGYDVVLSSGVMYHVLSPLHYILQLRKIVKLGGMVILETACAINDEIEMYHDYRNDAFVYGGRCSWFISTGALDLFFRAAFLKPLGFCYVRSQVKSDLNVVRLGIVAQAVDERVYDPEFFSCIDKSEIIRNSDYKPLYEAAQLTGSVLKPVAYRKGVLNPIGMKLSADLFEKHQPVEYEPEYLQLALSDK